MKKIKDKKKMLKRYKKVTRKNFKHKVHRAGVVRAERAKVIHINKVISKMTVKE